MHRGGIARAFLSVGLLVAAGWIFLNRQFVIDQLVVWQYSPSSTVERLAERADFSEKGRFYFFASRPSISDRTEFNKHCKNQENDSVVLGCYIGQRIYVFNVSDKRLDGVREVTAAHEMLHAAYERLSSDERIRIDGLLEKAVKKITDKRLQERLEVYERTEPGERYNELHSILATEIPSLGSELESYYARYFTNRKAVTNLYEKYASIFRSLEMRQTKLVSELKAMEHQLRQRTLAFNQSVKALNDEITVFNERANTEGGFSSNAEFQTARNELVAKQAALEIEQNAIKARHAEYETKYAELESLNLRANDLSKSLDSTPAQVPKL